MKKVLVLYYSQTGQLSEIIHTFTYPLDNTPDITLFYQPIEPVTPFPFPWPKLKFFDVFPESVYMDGCAIKPLSDNIMKEEYDLVILAYTVWFLSPSLPISGFLNSQYADILRNKPVITVIACRNMWLMAQEKIKQRLNILGARLLDNVVFIDQGGNIATFITTPRWMWTGKKNAVFGLPQAGVSTQDIKEASRFGQALVDALANNREKETSPLLSGLAAVNVDNKLIATEKVAHRSFLIWGKLIKRFGKTGDPMRIPALMLYFIFLLTLIVTVVPVNMLLKPVFYALNKEKTEQEKHYFELPSGSGQERLKDYQ